RWGGGILEQVVLDLVVEPAEEKVHQPAAAHVAGGQHLAPEEVQLLGVTQRRHALVVGSEGTAQVQAEQALLDQHEDRRLQRRQHQDQRGGVADDMQQEQQRLDHGGPAGVPDGGLGAGHVQLGSLQQQQWKEQVGLIAGDHPAKAPLVAGLSGGERQGRDVDVGIQVLVVGVAVGGGGLGAPPAEADPDQQVGMDQADQVVGAAAAEDLPVAGVVADEGDLGADDPQVGGGHKLPPGVLQGDKGCSSGGEQAEVQADLGGVVPVPPIQQTGLLDLPGELGVV